MLKTVFNRSAWLLAIAMLLPVGAQMAQAQETNVKIAVIDLEVVFASSKAGKALKIKLDKLREEAQKEIARLAGEAQAIRKQAGEQGAALSEERLTELSRQFEDKTRQLQKYQEDKQKEGDKLQSEGFREIEQQVQPILEKLRDERGLDLILNNVPGVVVNASPKVDVTKAVIDLLAASS